MSELAADVQTDSGWLARRRFRWSTSSKARRGRVPFAALAGAAWLIAAAICALFAQQIAPHDPIHQNLFERNIPPIWQSDGSWSHIFGTNALGQDLFSRVVWGSRPALAIGAAAVICSMIIGTTLGLVCGFFRGRIDSAIMALADAQLSMPFLVLALAIVSVLGRSTAILILLAGISGWMGFAREIRSQVLSLSTRDYVMASRSFGATNLHLMIRHVLPNVMPIVIVLVTNSIAGMILFESTMGFLGMGIPAPQPSWGSMISDGRDYLLSQWWLSVEPGVALILTVVACSLIGDWLRDRLDPMLRN